MAPILAYWKIRAIVEPIRYMLHHLGIEFEDRRISDPEQWFKEQKYSLGLDFPNLPYFIDGDLKMTQCLAICRHIARKHGLVGETETQLIRQDLGEQTTDDIRWGLIRLVLNPNFESLKDDFIKGVPEKMQSMDKYLGQGPWVVGDKLTHVDFLLFEALEQHLYLAPTCLEGLENLKAFHRRFRALPNVKAYLESDKFERWPLYGVITHFGNTNCPTLPPPNI